MIGEMEHHGATAVLAVKEETDPEAVKRNFAVILREDGTVRRVVEKPRHLPNMLKGCGLYLFDLPIFDAIRRTPRTAMRDEYELTDSIQMLIDFDYPVRVVPAVEWDINVTFIGDLIQCSRHVLERTHRPYLVGEACRLAPGVELVETVLGDRVTLGKSVRLERCVVLPDVELRDGEIYADSIITPDGVLPSYQEA
jgi:dTDP-glucose pyrophosphorylase